MTKLKNPIFSLDGSGQIGQATVLRSSRGQNILESKPIPRYTRTLPQVYQRWLYEDYIAYWHQQSHATKDQWRSDASRYHMTGFAYWISYHLKNLPDIAAWWKLDDNLGPTTIDSSKNQNTGTIIGASPSAGFINGCLSFDGLNDTVRIPYSPTLNLIPAFTITGFFTILSWLQLTPTLISRRTNYVLQFDIAATKRIRGMFFDGIVWRTSGWSPINSIIIGQLHHVALSWDSTLLTLYLDGYFSTSINWAGKLPSDVTDDLYLASYRGTSQWHHGLIDHAIIYNRVLTPSDIQRHSERRYS